MNALSLLPIPLAGEGRAEGPANSAACSLNLPPLAGRVTANAPLAPQTWFRVGGPAEALIRPADPADLARFLANLPPEIPVTILGAASNVIIRDGGLGGVTIRLARGFADIHTEPDGLIAGAACLDATVAEHAAAAALSGLEFLSGIPGSIGGAIAMNAGAYGSDVATTLDWAEFITRAGQLIRLPAAALDLTYRHAQTPAGAIAIRARFHAHPGDPARIAARMAEIRQNREATQPIRARTGGSTFRNPPGHKAWQLIDAAACRGLTLGGAQVSEKHCNFLLNTGTATASDLESLGEQVRTAVHAQTGITLDWEIKRLGRPLEEKAGVRLEATRTTAAHPGDGE